MKTLVITSGLGFSRLHRFPENSSSGRLIYPPADV
jgi:hypothetical protein